MEGLQGQTETEKEEMKRIPLALLSLILLSGCAYIPKSKWRDARKAKESLKNIIPSQESFYDIFGRPRKDDNTGSTEELPFEWSNVDWISSGSENVGDWPVTIGISVGSISQGDSVSWGYMTSEGHDRIKAYPKTQAIHNNPNACIGWVTEIDGQWYGGIGEWLLAGQTVQSKKLFKSDRGNKRVFQSPLKDFEPKEGQVFYLFVCGLNWNNQRNVKERSTLLAMVYHE